MPKEIEHKFLIKREALPKRLPRGKWIEQGFLSVEPVVRVRITSGGGRKSAFLTIKGKGLRVRSEFEYAIPLREAKELLKLCGTRTISKIRRVIGPFELDEFLGRHRGLWLAECELKSERARLPRLPAWIGKEVTGDPAYTNSRLAEKQFA